MTVFFWEAIAVLATALFLLCFECIVCLKNGIWEKQKERFGTVEFNLKIGIIILILFVVITTGNSGTYKRENYFREAFPLVVKGDTYLQDMIFVEPHNSELFEVYGYSEMERLLITITKNQHEIHYYPDTDKEIFEMLETTPVNMDDFLLRWVNGEWSPYR